MKNEELFQKTFSICATELWAKPEQEFLDWLSTESNQKIGHWILQENQRSEDTDNGNYCYTCSVCGSSDTHAKTQEVPYCWWCGSRMKTDSLT